MVDQITRRPHAEQLSLYEEVALARVACGEAVQMVSRVLEAGKKINDETRVLAMATLRESIDHVGSLVERASRIEHMAADRISVKSVDLFVRQMCAVVAEFVDTPTMLQIEEAVREKVRVPLGALNPADVNAGEKTPSVRIVLSA
jgi:hypothetical protein